MTEPVDQEVFTDECGNVVGKVQKMQKLLLLVLGSKLVLNLITTQQLIMD